MSKKVYIGVGHGNTDPGAVANGFKEKELALDVARYLYDDLMRQGIECKISRTDDSKVWLEQRISDCNKFKADLALDIHFNAGGGDGAEVYHTRLLGTGKKLADNILAEFGKIGQNSRGAKVKLNDSGTDYFGFIRQTSCPAVLVECAFIDNKTDIAIADTAAERKTMGIAIAKAVCKTLGITYKASAKRVSDTVYRVQVGAFANRDNAVSVAATLSKLGYDSIIVEGEAK